MQILDVKTVYTGGGIFEYIVQVDGDRWAMFDDEDLGREFVPVVDREPTDNDWNSDFFETHDAGYLVGEEATEFMREVLVASALNEWERGDRIERLYEEVANWH